MADSTDSTPSAMFAEPTWTGRRMHGWKTRMRWRHRLDQRMWKAEPSRRLGVSERTFHGWVASWAAGPGALRVLAGDPAASYTTNPIESLNSMVRPLLLDEGANQPIGNSMLSAATLAPRP